MKFSNKLLSEVAFFQEGPGVRKYQFRNEGVKLLNVGNINKGVLDTSTTKLYISEEEAYGKYKHFLVDEGDLLIASSGIVVDNFHNKIAYVKKEHLPLCLNTSTIRFKTLDENVFSLDYLKFYLKTTHFKNQLRKLITGAAQLNFGPSHLKKITLPVPTLPDQLHIANLLSKAENLIAQRKESIRLLDEFLKSTFLEMFGDPTHNPKNWQAKRLDEISTRITDGKHGDCVDEANSGYYFLSAKDLNDGKLKYTDVREITQSDFIEVHKRTDLKLNDILLGNTGASIGKIGIVVDAEKASRTTFQKSISIITLKTDLAVPLYLKMYLSLNRKIFNRTSTGSAMTNLLLSQIRAFNILLPPIEFQTQFAQTVEKTEALKTQYQQSLQELENLYGSLSQKAFRGELKMKQNV